MDDTQYAATEAATAEPDREFYNGYSVDDEDQPQSTGDSLSDDRGLPEPLDEGYSPPEKWSPGVLRGNTAYEESVGESLDERLVQEVPEPDPYEAAYAEEADDPDGREVGAERAGRLVEPDGGAEVDTEKDLWARDVGIDGAASSAEEAAVHVIADDS